MGLNIVCCQLKIILVNLIAQLMSFVKLKRFSNVSRMRLFSV